MRTTRFNLNTNLTVQQNMSRFCHYLRCRFGKGRDPKKGHAVRARNLRCILSGRKPGRRRNCWGPT